MDAYDKMGKPISLLEYSMLCEDLEYKRIGLTDIGDLMVSTVWLGFDHSFTESGPPIIFETMVFKSSAWHADRSDPEHERLLDNGCWRYSTLSEAEAGHEEICLLVRATTSTEASTDPEK